MNSNNETKDDDVVRRDESWGADDNQCSKLREDAGRIDVETASYDARD